MDEESDIICESLSQFSGLFIGRVLDLDDPQYPHLQNGTNEAPKGVIVTPQMRRCPPPGAL